MLNVEDDYNIISFQYNYVISNSMSDKHSECRNHLCFNGHFQVNMVYWFFFGFLPLLALKKKCWG